MAHIVLAQARPRLLGEMFLCIVIAAQRQHAIATGGDGRGAVLDAIADAVISSGAVMDLERHFEETCLNPAS